MVKDKISSTSSPRGPASELPSEDESILKEILQAALDTSCLDGRPFAEKMNIILDSRIKNELMFNNLLRAGVEKDFISVQDGIGMYSKSSKDSIVELAKLKRLLEDLSTDNISISVEEQAELGRLRGMVFGNG